VSLELDLTMGNHGPYQTVRYVQIHHGAKCCPQARIHDLSEGGNDQSDKSLRWLEIPEDMPEHNLNDVVGYLSTCVIVCFRVAAEMKDLLQAYSVGESMIEEPRGLSCKATQTLLCQTRDAELSRKGMKLVARISMSATLCSMRYEPVQRNRIAARALATWTDS
jgi:hypothetical protein